MRLARDETAYSRHRIAYKDRSRAGLPAMAPACGARRRGVDVMHCTDCSEPIDQCVCGVFLTREERQAKKTERNAAYRCPGCGLAAGAEDFRLGRIRRLSDPDIKAKLDAELAAMTPECARKWLLDVGFITERGELSERYGGPPTSDR